MSIRERWAHYDQWVNHEGGWPVDLAVYLGVIVGMAVFLSPAFWLNVDKPPPTVIAHLYLFGWILVSGVACVMVMMLGSALVWVVHGMPAPRPKYHPLLFWNPWGP